MEIIDAMATSVERAHRRMQESRREQNDSVLWTPLMRSKHWLERGSKPGAAPVYIKLESEQVTGSFKVRGALNRILCAAEASGGACIGPRIVTASTGNHAMAVAHALQLRGITESGERGCIFLPRGATEAKVKALREYHEVVELTFVDGVDCLEAELAAKAFVEQTRNAVYVSPCNDYEVISGQGTIAIEVMETLRNIGSRIDPYTSCGVIYVTVGGGGLVTGVGSFLKARAPSWRIVGAQPQNSPVMYASVKAGHVVEMKSLPTLSDGSAGGLEQGCLPLSYCTAVVDEWIIVNEEEISAAVRNMALFHKKIVEGAAGVALAAFSKDQKWRDEHPTAPAVVVACGSNIDVGSLVTILKS